MKEYTGDIQVEVDTELKWQTPAGEMQGKVIAMSEKHITLDSGKTLIPWIATEILKTMRKESGIHNQ